MSSKAIKELRQQHLKEAMENRPRRRQIEGVSLSRQAGIMYNARLQRLVNQIKKRIDANIIPLIKTLESNYTADSWSDDIKRALLGELDFWNSEQVASVIRDVAREFVHTANEANLRGFKKSMQSVGFDLFGDSPRLQDYLKATTEDNVALIKSIPEQYLQQVERSVMANMRAGQRPQVIVNQLRERYQLTQSRAKLIARDQASKINSGLSEQRQRSAGFEYFQWVESEDSRVRSEHHRFASAVTKYGKGIYRWDDPPRNSKGVPLTPGQDYQCRCTARPIPSHQIEKSR